MLFVLHSLLKLGKGQNSNSWVHGLLEVPGEEAQL